jgi:hypothetical protein
VSEREGNFGGLEEKSTWDIQQRRTINHTPKQVPKYNCIYDSQYHKYETFDMLTMAFNETCKRRKV